MTATDEPKLATTPPSASSQTDSHDIEKKDAADVAVEPSTDAAEGQVGMVDLVEVGYERSLKRRQIMMMAFGAGIGTGLWVGTGSALAKAGPGGIAVSYTIMAAIVYVMYTSIGEMTAYKPVHGGFTRQAGEYVDPALGFAIGINFWIIPAEITACISVLHYWETSYKVPLAAWITIFLVIIVFVNIWPVKLYGEVEFWFSFLKCLALVAIIFFMIVMTSGGIPATRGPIEFKYWKDPGAFVNGIRGIAAAFVQAGFSFGGGEHIAVMAGEAKDPRETVKRSVQPLFWRMFAFFVVNIWLVGMCIPYNDPSLVNASGTLASPFVLAIRACNLFGLAHALNAFILITVISCGITSAYIASRTLCALSDLKWVHPVFGRKDSQGRPYVAMTLSMILGGGLCYLNCNSTAEQVYNWFSSLVGISGFLQWATIYWMHIRFRKGLRAQGIEHKTLPFHDMFAPWSQYAGLVVIFLILVAEFYLAIFPFDAKPSAENFFATYIAAPLFVFDYFAYKWWYKTKIVRPEDMDFSEAFIFDELERQQKAEAEAEAAQAKEKPGLGVAGVGRRVWSALVG
ncbi:putative amino-acid permease meu22 [Diplodia seriata]|uniref:Putative amino-acid permease meu22 n=1 Tax=Diplodia seriata TaxID=420778 RepID=A0A1S8BD47_9PEZI|nr:putative amino-acid permease meu22 [Diplodia seriata]